MSTSIRVLIVDDHTVVREGLSALLSNPKYGVQVVGTAADGYEAVARARELRPDVILMDMIMPRKNGLEAIREILAERPETRILMLTSYSNDDDITAAIRSGAMGMLRKDSSVEELVNAIRSVAMGRMTLPPELTQRMLADHSAKSKHSDDVLTEREMDVLRCLAEGLSNKEIAERLNISTATVRSHVSHILSKLGVSNRTQAALYAREQGLIAD
jgi:NarL family two-component system response regulator LiaR